jgi:hypothetical protein
MVFVTEISTLERRFPKTYRMLSIYFRECDAELHQGDRFYTPEVSGALLQLMYTQARHKYTYETGIYLKPTQYADAPPNPPIMPSNTHGTVTINVAVLEGVAEVFFELRVLPSAGFSINYRNMYVKHALIEIIVETRRLANWEDVRRLKPNPVSAVV